MNKCTMGVNSSLLRNCDKEPVHIPGSIQGYGGLLVIDSHSGRITQAAGCLERLLGRPLEAIFGSGLPELFAPRCRSDLAELLETAGERPRVLRVLTPASHDSTRLSATAYAIGQQIVLELEDSTLATKADLSRLQDFCCEAQEEFSLCNDLEALFRCIVSLVRRLTGFDRVMLYQFHHDYSGEVVAEDKQDRLQAFMGHRYPSSDIPEPARRMYLKNWLRLISDVDMEQAALQPDGMTISGTPLDMTYSRLRAVSPIHIEYLKNMGVGASLSLSVLVGGKLWGLLACHHYKGPLFFSWEVQRALTLVAQCFSMNLSTLLARNVYKNRLAKEDLLAKLQTQIKGVSPLEVLFKRISKQLMGLVGARGIALVSPSALLISGKTPGITAVTTIAKWLPLLEDGDVHSTNSLSLELLEGKNWKKTASGLLALRFGGVQNTFIIWFRPEFEVKEVWGGDPEKPYTLNPETGRISPRKSFVAYNRTVKGVSLLWTEHDVFAAKSLVQILNLHSIRIAKAVIRQNEKELREKNILLEQLSLTDSLTGVANRRHVIEVLEVEIARAQRYALSLSVAMIDIDNFKSINDQYGHLAGDRVLSSLASTMRTEARAVDSIGRYGGEEFLMVMPGTALEGAIITAERIRTAIEHTVIKGIEHGVTVSMGISTYAGEGLVDFIGCADVRLYEAKKAGKNRVVYS